MEGSSSVVLFQATNGNPVMRFSNATHVCVLNNACADDDVDVENAERAFAVLRLAATDGRSSPHSNNDGNDMFTDISMGASASVPTGISAIALIVMHDLAVHARSADASLPAPSPVLPIPKVLPSASHQYVLSYNARLRRGQEASIFVPMQAPASRSLLRACCLCFLFLLCGTKSLITLFRALQALNRALCATLSSCARAISCDTLQESDPQRLQPVLRPLPSLQQSQHVMFSDIARPDGSASCSARDAARSSPCRRLAPFPARKCAGSIGGGR
jgi:hypothetical protein